MKKICVFILLIGLLLSGCNQVEKDITCEDIVAAYEDAGYEVVHNENAGFDYDCYIMVENENGDTIYFHRFPTAVEAQSLADARQYHVLIWFFTVIYGDPTWVHTTTYGCYEIEYTSEALYDPFEKLIR